MRNKISQFFQGLKENTEHAETLRKFLMLFVAIALFAGLSLNGTFSSNPQVTVPQDFNSLKTITSLELEDQLRAKATDVKEIVFIDGTRSVAVLYSGFENHKMVHNANLKQVEQLAKDGQYKTKSVAGKKLDGFFETVVFWWWPIAIFMAIWTLVFLFKKGDRQVTRFQFVQYWVANKSNGFVAKRNWRRSRFYLSIWLASFVALILLVNFRAFNRDAIPEMPSDYSRGARVPAWYLDNYLESSPAEFQRAIAVDGANAVQLTIRAPENAKGERLVVERVVVFGEGPVGKQNFDAFVRKLNDKKVSVRVVEPVMENEWTKTMTGDSAIQLGVIALVVVFGGLILLGRWEHWSKAEKGMGPGANTPPLSADNNSQKPPVVSPKYNDVDLGNSGGVQIAAEDKKTLADVAGCDEAVEKFRLVARWIKDATVYRHYGAKLPKGVLLYGPPGTGKTLLARALAGEVDGNYFYASGSEFVNKYVGVGADNVRALFGKARDAYQRTKRPSIVFIDEIDAVGKHRSEGGGSGGDAERDQTVNQLLTSIQGFDPNNGTLVIAATNRPETLDTGLTRSGRFDYKVEIGRPDKKGRAAIFKVYLKNRQLEEGVDLDQVCADLARRAHDFVGADIELAVNEAATRAAERNAHKLHGLSAKELAKQPRIVERRDLHAGVDQVKYGELIKSKVRSDKERRATAIHEVGHACVPTVLRGDPVSRITIVMTSKSLGLMESAPDEDRYGWSRDQFIVRIKTMLAGRIAEEQIGGEVSTGASNDFERASQLARQMVGIFGMSTELGLISLPLNKAGFPASDIGPDLFAEFNRAWRKIISDCETATRKLIDDHRDCIVRTSEALLEEETLTGERFHELWSKCPTGCAPQYPCGVPEEGDDKVVVGEAPVVDMPVTNVAPQAVASPVVQPEPREGDPREGDPRDGDTEGGDKQ